MTEKLAIPSQSSFIRALGTLDLYDVIEKRYGKREADRVTRITRTQPRPERILDVAEIDHTPLDLMVICEKTKMPLGRPYLTLVIDRHSRMILGYYIGFEPPSSFSVMSALCNAILPKHELMQRLGITGDWPCYGIMTTLVLDNGREFHAIDFERTALELRMELMYCPKYCPEYKGAVERALGKINRKFAGVIPGKTFAKISERQGYKSENEAILTLEELEAALVRWIIEVYGNEYNRGICRSPLAAWKAGLSAVDIRLPPSPECLQVAFMHEVERRLWHYGVELHGLRYQSYELGEILRKKGHGKTVRIRYLDADLRTVLVYSEVRQDFVVAYCDQDEYVQGLHLHQHKGIQRYLRARSVSEIDGKALLEAKLQLHEEIQRLTVDPKLKNRKLAARNRRCRTNDSERVEKDRIQRTPSEQVAVLSRNEELNFDVTIFTTEA